MAKMTRRDFINGTLMVAGASMLPFGATGEAVLGAMEPSYYPPARTGLRGSHPGSNEHAHSRAWAGKSVWGPTTDLKEAYDLVVVGGGIGVAFGTLANKLAEVTTGVSISTFFTDLAIPGWATNLTGILGIVLLNLLLLATFSVLLMLNSRDRLSFLPLRDWQYFVENSRIIHD